MFTQLAPDEMASAPAATAAVVQSFVGGGDSEDDAHTLRIEAARLYQVMNLIGEMVIIGHGCAEDRSVDGVPSGRWRSGTGRDGAVQAFQKQFEFNVASQGEIQEVGIQESEFRGRRPGREVEAGVGV